MSISMIGKGNLLCLTLSLLFIVPVQFESEIEGVGDIGDEIHEASESDTKGSSSSDISTDTDLIPGSSASGSDTEAPATGQDTASSSDIEQEESLPALPEEGVFSSICEAADTSGLSACLSTAEDHRLKLLADITVNAAQLPEVDTDVLSIDLNGCRLQIVADEENVFTPLRCSLFQLINDTDAAGIFTIDAANSNLPSLIEVGSYAFFAGASAGIQVFSQSGDDQAYTMINLAADATVSSQTSRFMTNHGNVLDLIQREGKSLTQTDWIDFANINQHTEFLKQQILYYSLLPSPFLYADADKYQVQIEWGDLNFAYDGGHLSDPVSGWHGNDNTNNHIRINNYSLFPINITHELTLDDKDVKGEVYKSAGIRNENEYDYSMSESAAYEEKLIAAASNLPTQLDLYIVLTGSPNLERYRQQKQIGSLTLSVSSPETNVILSEDEEHKEERYSLQVAEGETLTLSGDHEMKGNVFHVSGGGTVIVDQFQAIDAQDGDLIAECDENSRLIAGSQQDLIHYRFIDGQGKETAEPAAVQLIYRKEEIEEGMGEAGAADEQPK